MKNIANKKESRRDFIKKAATATTGISIIPAAAVSGLGHKAPSDKMNIVGVGVGGKGFINLKAMETENIIGLCDVDWKYAQRCFDRFPKAKKYWDYRTMYDELGNDIDGVMISTPDHTHAIVTAKAIEMGKHVYCQKPLTHNIYESRLLNKLAAKYKVATQMGNQGSSGPDVRKLCEWIWNGEIGEIKEVHAWTNRPIWPQGLELPEESMKPPKHLNWDLFLGPATARPYHASYHPWNWRGWWDFGTGAFGDMACHVLEPAYRALKLEFPNQVKGSSTQMNIHSAPQAETVEYSFPARNNLPKLAMPAVKVYWYDGGLLPMRSDLLPPGENLMADGMGGCLFVGSKDAILCSTGGFNPRLLSGRVPKVKEELRRVPGYNVSRYIDGPHEQDWIRACKESAENRTATAAEFAYAAPFNEMVLLGVLAIRLQGLQKPLEWNAEEMKFSNITQGEPLKVMEKDNFMIKNGHPHFNHEYVTLDALQASQQYVKRDYRDGWQLPDMP